MIEVNPLPLADIPWLALAVLVPLAGALWLRRLRDPDTIRRHSLLFAAITLLATLGAALAPRPAPGAAGHWLELDDFSAPLLPLAALIYFLTQLATLRTKMQRFSFAATLVRESILLATLACRQPWGIVLLLTLGTIPPWLELRSRGRPTRVFVLHMALFVGLLVAGQALVSAGGTGWRSLAATLLVAAVLLRSGVLPLHLWIADLFEHASFGTALLTVTPMVGAYAAVRLVLPLAPQGLLQAVSVLSLATALYAAGMALVQQEARRFFGFLALSHASLVLVGLETINPVGLTGALCLWVSAGLSLTGFGLTLRSVESRTGKLLLDQFHGLYEHTPMLAILFLLTGLGSIGFPGTLGFIGTELLVEGAVRASPARGVAIVLAAALNSLALLHVYFRVFTGKRHPTAIDLRIRPPEQVAALILALLLLGGGLVPQPGVENRYRVAAQLHQQRQALGPQDGQPAIDGEASTSHGAFSSSVFGMRESLP
jgi:NADH-quinone oxidoreductase subunit M